ncbi:hypothetical protein VULLAG_LOCUS20054 [Vulpes lagopus]
MSRVVATDAVRPGDRGVPVLTQGTQPPKRPEGFAGHSQGACRLVPRPHGMNGPCRGFWLGAVEGAADGAARGPSAGLWVSRGCVPGPGRLVGGDVAAPGGSPSPAPGPSCLPGFLNPVGTCE